MSDRLIHLLLIDDDPIFRLGLVTALSHYPQWEIIGQVDNFTDALDQLSSQSVDLVILEPNLQNEMLETQTFCQQIKQDYPHIKVCLLSNSVNYRQLQQLQELGIEGYCSKGKTSEELIEIFHRILQNESVWPSLVLPEQSIPTSPRISHQNWLSQWQQSGKSEIEVNLKLINDKLQQNDLSKFDKIFWQGRRRELLVAQWLVSQLIPTNTIIIDVNKTETSTTSMIQINAQESQPIFGEIIESNQSLTIINQTIDKLQGGLKNLTTVPLEIDILKPEIKQEILLIILTQFRRILNDLKYLNPEAQQLTDNIPLILQKLWRESTLSFLGKYCIEKQNFRLEDIENIIQDYENLVAVEILFKIPFVIELFDYLLFESHLMIDQVLYRPESPEAQEKAEKLLQNLMIQIANGIMSLILNNFPDREPIKQNLYNINMASSREIAKFRNRLAWQYRKETYWEEPRNIFESQYRIFFLREKGLDCTLLYAPRQTELQSLSGIRWGVTLLLEIRDALSPLVRSIIAAVGNGLVYVLTQVIGRGIGLIGRGIIQGIGNSLQENTYDKKRSERNSKF